MKLYLMCPQWGREELDLEEFVAQVKDAGYDGIDTWVPERSENRARLIELLERYDLRMVSHQFRAAGNDIHSFCKSFEYHLYQAAETNPLLINSHSGRDWFTRDEQLRVIDTATAFQFSTGIKVVHETHRGRIGFSPGNFREIFSLRADAGITADLSHWVCVTESFLEGFSEILCEAIQRTFHVHARVGFTQGAQVPGFRHPAWDEAWMRFTGWWTRIVRSRQAAGADWLTVTPEFGPPPYMWTDLENGVPVSSQWELNLYIQEWFRKNFTNL